MILDILFPKRCLNCGKFEDFLCRECKSSLKIVGFQRCPNCKRKSFCGKFCRATCAKNFFFDQLILGFLYGKNTILQKLVVNFKYKFLKSINVFFVNVLRYQFLKFFGSERLDGIVVVPVPMSKQKIRIRGENHSRILAYNFAKKMGLKFCDAMYREHREDQAKLGRSERLINLRGSIFVKSGCGGLLEGKIIILVDDIVTTCSTANECSKVLKMAKASYVCVLALARG